MDWLELTDIRHHWGNRSIDVDMDARAAAKSMGRSIQVHTQHITQLIKRNMLQKLV